MRRTAPVQPARGGTVHVSRCAASRARTRRPGCEVLMQASGAPGPAGSLPRMQCLPPLSASGLLPGRLREQFSPGLQPPASLVVRPSSVVQAFDQRDKVGMGR